MTMPLDSPRLTAWAVELAEHVAKLSKDPSTRVGAVIFDEKRRIISTGYNGLPRGVRDTDQRLTDRSRKLRMVQHAERNALAFASRSVDGATLVCTHPCCAQCAGAAIQAGISNVVWPKPSDEMVRRWGDDFADALVMFKEADVNVFEV